MNLKTSKFVYFGGSVSTCEKRGGEKSLSNRVSERNKGKST